MELYRILFHVWIFFFFFLLNTMFARFIQLWHIGSFLLQYSISLFEYTLFIHCTIGWHLGSF